MFVRQVYLGLIKVWLTKDHSSGMSGKENWSDWVLNGPASEACLKEVELFLGRKLPSDYERFLRENNGGEGFISENYLILWRAEELVGFNGDYEVENYAPGLFLFGSDGGGEGYGFDMRNQNMSVVMVPFVGMSLSYAKFIATGFDEFLRKLEG